MRSKGSPTGEAGEITVTACTPQELRALQSAMPSQHHDERYAVQVTAEGLYFVARLGRRVSGHLLLRWSPTEQVFRQTGLVEPCIEALGVDPPVQSRGVGTALIAVAEDAVRQRGAPTVGLAVGVANPRARALYERLGYRDAGLAPFELSWNYVDGGGRVQRECELCVYVRKGLGGDRAVP